MAGRLFVDVKSPEGLEESCLDYPLDLELLPPASVAERYFLPKKYLKGKFTCSVNLYSYPLFRRGARTEEMTPLLPANLQLVHICVHRCTRECAIVYIAEHAREVLLKAQGRAHTEVGCFNT